MTYKDFEQRVQQAAEHLRDPIAVSEALLHHKKQGDTENRHVSACVELAGRFSACLGTGQDEPAASDTTTRLTSDTLRGMIAPEVEQVRKDLFGASTPPFSTWTDAAEWLAGLRTKEERSADDIAQANHLLAEWLDDPRRHEFENVTGKQALVTQRAHVIPYVAPTGDHVTHAVVSHGSPFVALEMVSNRLADATGFSGAAVVMHILCDTQPILPSVRLTRVLTGNRRVLRVEFNSPDVTQAQMLELLGEVRGLWGRTGSKRVNEKDQQFLDLIHEEGGVPDSGRSAFFEKVSEKCTAREIGDYKRSGWRGSYRRWQRLMEKLGTQENEDVT